jgi:hypothetical protein
MVKRTCSVDTCEREVHCRGWCRPHYQRQMQFGDPRAHVPIRGYRHPGCSVPGCDRVHDARGYCKQHYKRPEHDARCSIDGCEEPEHSRTWCRQHYNRWHYHGDPLVEFSICEVADCQSLVYIKSRRLCSAHYQRWLKYGDPTVRIKASPGQADFIKNGYHFIHVGGRIVQEHRYIMERQLERPLLPGENVHHKNGFRHDNRPENLELWLTLGSQPKGQRVSDLLAYVTQHYPAQLIAMLREQGHLM